MTALTSVLSTPEHSPSTTEKMNVGQTVVVTCTPGGGSSYHYAWTLNSGSVGTDSATYSYTAGTNADSIVCTVSGSGGTPGASTPLVITVAATLVMTLANGSSVTIMAGETLHLVATKVGGTSTFSYLWQTCDDASGTNPQSATTTTIAKDYAPIAGVYYIRIRCIDSADVPVTAYSACITVTVSSIATVMTAANAYMALVAKAVT